MSTWHQLETSFCQMPAQQGDTLHESHPHKATDCVILYHGMIVFISLIYREKK